MRVEYEDFKRVCVGAEDVDSCGDGESSLEDPWGFDIENTFVLGLPLLPTPFVEVLLACGLG
jgi:hypothetical protein